MNTNYAGNDNTVFSGTFDGRGYTIDGVTTMTAGIFGKVTGDVVIKNFALTNATNNCDSLGGLFVKHFESTASLTFENIYIHMTTLNVQKGAMVSGVLFGDIPWSRNAITCTNIIVTADNVSTGTAAGATYILGSAATSSTLTNVYAYNVGSVAILNGTTTGSVGTYTDKATFEATITDYTAFTSTGYWTYDATNGLAFVVKS